VRMRRHDSGAAGPAVHPQVLEALEPPALALPVSDRVLDELQLAGSPEVREGEDAGEDRLEAGLLALLRQEDHLQEPLVGAALHADQVRKLHERPDLRKRLSLGGHAPLTTHFAETPSAGGRDPAAVLVENTGTKELPKSPMAYLISTFAPTSSNFF